MVTLYLYISVTFYSASAVHLKRCAVFFFPFPCYDGDRKKKERTKHMGYILELRKQVGHRPLIMTCAGVLLSTLKEAAQGRNAERAKVKNKDREVSL